MKTALIAAVVFAAALLSSCGNPDKAPPDLSTLGKNLAAAAKTLNTETAAARRDVQTAAAAAAAVASVLEAQRPAAAAADPALGAVCGQAAQRLRQDVEKPLSDALDHLDAAKAPIAVVAAAPTACADAAAAFKDLSGQRDALKTENAALKDKANGFMRTVCGWSLAAGILLLAGSIFYAIKFNLKVGLAGCGAAGVLIVSAAAAYKLVAFIEDYFPWLLAGTLVILVGAGVVVYLRLRKTDTALVQTAVLMDLAKKYLSPEALNEVFGKNGKVRKIAGEWQAAFVKALRDKGILPSQGGSDSP